MKIIGIYGASGAGKSTVSKLLLKYLPNSLLINGDYYMMEQLQIQDEKIFKKLKIKKEKGVFSSNYIFQSFENQNKTIKVIEKAVITSIKEQIEHEGNNKDYIIIDWLFLPLCKYFERCNITICVTANYEKRLERLTNRLKNETIHKIGTKLYERYKEGIIENRVKFTALNEYGYKSNIEIENNDNEIALENKVKNILKELQ